MENIYRQKFFLYARKSTDVEDKQVLSIEAQLQELRDYAKRENLNIALEFIEKQSAKVPGRPIFNEMMMQTIYLFFFQSLNYDSLFIQGNS